MPDVPLLKVALVCETVIQRVDGVLSLVNIVDRRSITVQDADAPAEMPPHEWEFYLVVMFVSGSYVGKARISIAVQSPDGLRKPVHSTEVFL